MKHVHRLVALDYPGVVSPRPFSFLLSSGAIWKQAAKAGLVAGVRRLCEDKKDLDSSAPLILDFSPNFDPALNTDFKPDAPGTQSGGLIIEQLPTAFKGGLGIGAGVGWTVSDPTITGTLSGSKPISQNGAHCIRFYLERPATKTDGASLGGGALWQYRFDAWQFQVRDGKFEMMRRLPAWTQGAEDSLQSLQKQKGADGEQIALSKAQIYADFTECSLGEAYNRVVCLTFIAEPGPGSVHIFSYDGHYHKVERSDVRDARLTPTEGVGTVWARGARSHRSRGHLWFAQWGAPQFLGSATVKSVPQMLRGPADSLSNCRKTGVWDTNWAGTNVSLNLETTDSTWNFKLMLTGDGSGTPFVYNALATLDPGERSGTDNVFWDSDDHKRKSGHTIIKSVTPQFDGARRTYKVEIWDSSGSGFSGASLNLQGNGLHCLEGRMVNLYTNGDLDVWHGLILDATPGPLASVEDGLPRANAALPNTLISLTVGDGHAMLDDAEVEADAIGDTLNGNEWLRFWLMCAGARASELTQIPTNFEGNLGFGEVLPKIEGAAWGENPRERPALGAKIGSYLEEFTGDYGLGALLLHGTQGWTFARIGNTVRSWNGTPIEFWGKGKGRSDPNTYPGRLCVLEPLEAPRDWTDAFNEFPVEGAELPDGTRVTASYVLHESQDPLQWNNPAVRNHMGRVRRAPVYRKESLRTKDQCWRAARGRAALKGACPGRYYHFETYYHWFLRPYDVISVFGRICRIDRIPQADSARDRMQIAAREL